MYVASNHKLIPGFQDHTFRVFHPKAALLRTAIENVTRYTRNVEKKRHTKLLLGSYISKIAIQSIVLGLQSNKYETKQRGI